MSKEIREDPELRQLQTRGMERQSWRLKTYARTLQLSGLRDLPDDLSLYEEVGGASESSGAAERRGESRRASALSKSSPAGGAES